jgi:hypothetical protein
MQNRALIKKWVPTETYVELPFLPFLDAWAFRAACFDANA